MGLGSMAVGVLGGRSRTVKKVNYAALNICRKAASLSF